jgi:hypothetical protein
MTTYQPYNRNGPLPSPTADFHRATAAARTAWNAPTWDRDAHQGPGYVLVPGNNDGGFLMQRDGTTRAITRDEIPENIQRENARD